MTDLSLLPGAALARGFRAGELSPVDATAAVLERIERHDPAVNAFCLVDAERAMGDARASEARWRRAAPASPLDGIPVAVKDVFLTKGWPTLKGSETVDADRPWEVDAPSTAALRRGGAVLVGKTTTPEFGWKGVTDSPRHGVTRNPWDPARTAGGSSGGSSAAVVLGMAALATGTDAGGSIRIPASFCGHPGFKPTFGRVPHWPPSPYGTLAHAGPMARTVEDLALLLDLLVHPDPRDPAALPEPPGAFADAVRGSVEGMRIAFSPDLGWVDVAPEVAGPVAAAASAFEEMGATVEEVGPGFADPLEIYWTLWCCSAAALAADLPSSGVRRMDPGLQRIAKEGRRVSAVEYLAASARRAELGVLMGEFHREWDLLLTPTTPLAAFAIPGNVPEGWPDDRWPTWTPFTYPFNLTQQPAASVPCGLTPEGLPVGLQIVGPRHADARVLRAARAFEEVRPFAARPALLDSA